jgi:hypothetical protein
MDYDDIFAAQPHEMNEWHWAQIYPREYFSMDA